jgi:hypothetical protein
MAAVNHERVSVLVQRDDVETILQAGLVIDGGDDPGGSSDFDVTSSTWKAAGRRIPPPTRVDDEAGGPSAANAG